MVGATLRWRHATTFSVRVEPGVDPFGGNDVVTAVLQIVLARPDYLRRSAIHCFRQHGRLDTKSHFDLRPKPPPSNVTWAVTSSSFKPSFLASSSRVLPGLCTQAQASHLPSATRTVALGGSIVACAMSG
jgi:hypothetical protein